MPWHINGVRGREQVRIIQLDQRVLEIAENRIQLLRRANDQGSRMRRDDDLMLEQHAAGLITFCRVEVRAKPALQATGG